MRNLSLALALLLSGCAVKNIDENYQQIVLKSDTSDKFSVSENWWGEYKNERLNSLVELVLKNNIDLAKSAIAINKALAQAGVLDANLLPSFSASLGIDGSRKINTNDNFAKSYTSGVNVSYELDLWRKLANTKDAALWEAEATKFDLAATRLSAINSVIDGYFNILYLNESLKLYNNSLQNYNELERIIQTKFNLGKEEELNLKQIKSSVLSIKNNIKNTQKELIVAKQTMRVLLAVEPKFELNINGILSDVSPIGVDIDVPIQAVSNRPDLQAAIARIEESLLNVRVSEKEFYPNITIGASIKGSGDRVGDITRLNILGGSVALSLPFLNYSKLKANLRISEAEFENVKLTYLDILNKALNEIDTAYQSLQKDKILYENYIKQTQNYTEISQIYNDKYNHGKSELKDFLEAKNSEIDAKINLLNAKYKILQDEINVYKSLAGKFNAK
ncbi:TolC family protein [Campylobacter sp. faydin G-140]|uniref:TolC family protein n=1 Tax=Campylobacter anatolicus TaxID=2829105 RepID=UPI001BA140E3|nr:TolC family protein [Campylobacter anatolicus]MBR8465888.1 TolC family protein [Campylobacter anatolicus]